MYRKSTPEEIQAIQELNRTFDAIKELWKEEEYTEEMSIEYQREQRKREREYREMQL